MTDRPIQVGDLAVVVRGHNCVLELYGGVPFTVTALLAPYGGGWHCPKCDRYSAGPNAIGAEGLTKKDCGIPLSWLRRIPPLSELEGKRTQESLREPRKVKA